MRPGRFDTNVVVPLPDVKGREQLLELYVKPVPLEDDVKLGTIARACQGFSGADISNLVNVAALKVTRTLGLTLALTLTQAVTLS